MTYFQRSVVALGVVLLSTIALSAQAPQQTQAQREALERYFNQKLKNLQVFPKDIPRPKLIPIMDSFGQALGVQCSYCHVGPPGACNPTPDGETKTV